jgi:hypothetical protein
MVVVLGLLIVTAVLALSGGVVLFALASEAEVLPPLTRGASSGGDEPAASPGSQVPLSN